MTCYAGITTDLERRKKEHESNYPNLYGWEQYQFPNRETAQNWENQQTGCQHHPGGQEPDNQFSTWYGYKFYY